MLAHRTMVGVAQLVEHRVVIPVVAGSSPVTHPTNAQVSASAVMLPPTGGDTEGILDKAMEVEWDVVIADERGSAG